MKAGRLKKFILFPVSLAALGMAVLVLMFSVGPARYIAIFPSSPTAIELKTGDLTANFTGRKGLVGLMVQDIAFRANQGEWHRFMPESPRVNARDILVEVPAAQLRAGANSVDVALTSYLGQRRQVQLMFDYDPRPVDLPLVRSWDKAIPEIQDGRWERVQTDLGWRLRPVPGAEGYDRLVLASPPFTQGRRGSVDVTFLESTGALFGFGLIPLWGGHNDPEALSPRRGWEYGIAWYYSHKKGGFGVEVSQKYGSEKHRTSKRYQKADPVPGETYRLIAEAWPEKDASGRLLTYHLRMKWSHPASGAESDWIGMTDAKVPLQDKPYAVALVAHRVQAEFGPVTIESID